MECQYGCGQKAIHKTKGGKNICAKSPNQCPVNKRKNSIGIKKAFKEGRMPIPFEGKRDWTKNKTKEEIEQIRKKQGETLSRRIKEGKIIPHFTGKSLSKEHKQKISLKMKGTRNGLVKTKYYEVFCPYDGEYKKVQGTWEYKVAIFLNENKIPWSKSRKISLTYTLHKDDYNHTYYPDFYLPYSNEYIEVKGYWWKSKDGRVDDKRKWKRILMCNKDKKFVLLQKQDLIDLEIL